MSSDTAPDYYRVLGVNRDASIRQIRKAYRTWVRQIHPDHNPDPDALPFGAPDLIIVNEAWSVLCDPVRRKAYDKLLDPKRPSTVETLLDALPPIPRGFEAHPRASWVEWSGWAVVPAARAADAVRGALSLSAESEDLSGLASLGPEQLWLLDARDRPITDFDLQHLLRFHRLEVLALDHTEVTDSGLDLLRKFPELRTVSLTGCQIGDDGARALASVKTLQDVELDRTSVTDLGAAAFSGHPELRVLDLRKSKVRGEGLEELAQLPKLDQLRVTGRARRKATRIFRNRPEVSVI